MQNRINDFCKHFCSRPLFDYKGFSMEQTVLTFEKLPAAVAIWLLKLTTSVG